MALSRLTVWAANQILTAATLNAEFNNILNNALTLISPLTADLNFNSYKAKNIVLESHPPTTSTAGQLAYFGTEGLYIGYTGSGPTVVILGPHSGISRVSGLTGSLISNIGSFSANAYQLRRAGAFPSAVFGIATTSSFSVNTQTAGPLANGRDQAAAFGSTDVHFYAISTGYASTSIAGLVSSQPPPTGPTMPSSYNSWAYLCSAKYSTGSSALAEGLIITGSKVIRANTSIAALVQVATSTQVVGNLSTGVPSMATQIFLNIGVEGQASTAGRLLMLPTVAVTSSAYGWITRVDLTSTPVPSYIHRFDYQPVLPNFNTTPTVYLNTNFSAGASGTYAVLYCDALGYTVPNGDQ